MLKARAWTRQTMLGRPFSVVAFWNGRALSREPTAGVGLKLAPRKLYRVVLVRHGESVWNIRADERFTGWTDVPLSAKGREEAIAAGRILAETGIRFDVAFTSLLKRAKQTCETIIECTEDGRGPAGVRLIESWRLNERHYGSLTGLNKNDTAKAMDSQQVHEWRRGIDERPPEMEKSHVLYDLVYGDTRLDSLDVPKADLPRTESLRDCGDRLMPLWRNQIVPEIRKGRTVLVAAHANSLRALLRESFNIPDDVVRDLRIPTGVPLVYHLKDKDGDSGLLEPLDPPLESNFRLGGDFLWPSAAEPLKFDAWYDSDQPPIIGQKKNDEDEDKEAAA